MSGSIGSAWQIPMAVQPFDPFSGGQKMLANQATEAGIGQTQAQTGLLAAQARTAEINNQIAGARLPFLMQAYGGPGGGSSGPPGAIGASGGQDWTGPHGVIPDEKLFGQLGSIPKGLYNQMILSPSDKWFEVGIKAREQKNAYVNQAVNETLDPATGQADPAKWNQMITKEVNDGWMTASQARNLWGHPEMAQTLVSSTLPANETPGTREEQSKATARGAATQELVTVNIPIMGADGKPTGQTQQILYRKSDLTAGGQPKPGAQPAAQYGPPIQATDLPPTAQNFLRALSPSEANAPNQRYVPPGSNRPATFDTSQGHPGEGAAGLFQFEPETWQRAAQLAGVDPKNMSQPNQERAAWALAQDDYAKNTNGRSLMFDLNRGNYAQVAAGLKSTWPSINGGDQQNKVGATFTQRLAGIMGQPAAGTAQVAGPGAPTGPNGQAQPATPNPQVAGGGVAAAAPVQLSPQVQQLANNDETQVTKDAETNQANLTSALHANQAALQARELRGLVKGSAVGGWAEQRMALQRFAQQFGGDAGAQAMSFLTSMDKPGLEKMEQIAKLTQQLVVAQEQAIGPGTRIGAMFTNFMAKASPNVNMQEPATEQIINRGLIAFQMARDFAEDSNKYFVNARTERANALSQGRYTPYRPLSNLEGEWVKPGTIHSPETYEAAANLLNGVKAATAFKDLTPAQITAAVGIVSRADPNAGPEILKRPDVIAWRKSLAK